MNRVLFLILLIVSFSYSQYSGYGSGGITSLNNTWTGTNTFTGAVTFSSTVTFTGNITAPLTVDYTGTGSEVSAMSITMPGTDQIDFGLVGGNSSIYFDGSTSIRFWYLLSGNSVELLNRATGGNVGLVAANEVDIKTNHTVSALNIDVNQDVTVPVGDLTISTGNLMIPVGDLGIGITPTRHLDIETANPVFRMKDTSPATTTWDYMVADGTWKIRNASVGQDALTIDLNENVTIPGGDLTVSAGNVDILTTTTSTSGVITKGSTPFIHNFHHPTGNTAVPDGNNTFVGENAGNFTMGSTATSTVHGSYNTGIGASSLASNSTGYYNTGIGYLALNSNSGGKVNMALGHYSMAVNTSGNNNAAIGAYSLGTNTSGSNNVAIGLSSGRYLADGASSNTSPDFSTYLGYDTRSFSTLGNQQYEVVIGSGAIGNGSNTVTIGNSSNTANYFTGDLTVSTGNVGIGTTTPLKDLDLSGSARIVGNGTTVLTGSIDPTASTSVVGVGTAFDTELVRGDKITVSGETRTVSSVTDATNLTVNYTFSDNANDTSPDKIEPGLIVKSGDLYSEGFIVSKGTGDTGAQGGLFIPNQYSSNGFTGGIRIGGITSEQKYADMGWSSTNEFKWAIASGGTRALTFENANSGLTTTIGNPTYTSLNTLTANGDLDIGSASADDVQPALSIIGDADSAAASDTDETFGLTLIPNATPASAVWAFTSTQISGYKDGFSFDKGVSVTAQEALFRMKDSDGGAVWDFRNNAGIFSFYNASTGNTPFTINGVGSVGTPNKAITLAASVTTFAVSNNVMTITGDAGGNTIATITGASDGAILTLRFVDALVTITDTGGATSNTVNLSAAFTSTADDVMQLMYDGTSWYEVSRSLN